MKTLVFKDGSSFNFTDTSTIEKLTTVVETLAEVDELTKLFTTENFIGGTFDGKEIKSLVADGIDATKSVEDKNYVVTLSARTKTREESLEERVAELESIIDTLTQSELEK